MQTDYDKAYALERKYEGGNDDDPRDPGGRTSRGIIQREYDAYRDRKGAPRRDVWTADENEIAEIYKVQYWDVVRGDELAPGIDVVVFDGAVNSGPVQSAKWLQRALDVTADGHIGEVTLDAVRNHPDHDLLIEAMIDQRNAYLRHLSTFDHFGRGWIARTTNLKKIGQAWASGSVGPAPADLEHSAKADPSQLAQKNPGTSIAVTTGAGVGGGAIGQLQDAVQPLSAFQDTLNVVKYLILAVAFIGFGYTVYSIWKNNKIAQVS